MGITRDKTHKRTKSGGRQKPWHKKRKYHLARPPALTKLGPRRVHHVRVRGGNTKFRGLRLDAGNFSWGSESISRKTRILNCVYNPANHEYVRTNTLVKNTIVQIDGAPFRQWYEQFYGILLGKKKTVEKKEGDKEDKGPSKKLLAKQKSRAAGQKLNPLLQEQFTSGRVYACLSSRPGQVGRADGYILEGPELDFYLKKLAKKGKVPTEKKA